MARYVSEPISGQFSFSIPAWKHQKTRGFVLFSGIREERWLEMG